MSNRKYLAISKYQVDYTQLLGQGAMAKVYLGYYQEGHGDPSVKFAVKEISVNSLWQVTDSLLQEINILRKISHPFIVRYVDAKKSPNSLYLFLEYCDKGTLEEEVANSRDSLALELVRRYIAQLAIALNFLKRQNIIHRDIKPRNILLNCDGVKLSDFGVAKLVNSAKPSQEAASLQGTIQYMSPQVLREEPYSYATDVWSLGVTLYFVVFRCLPWQATTVFGIRKELEAYHQVPIPECPEESLRHLLGRMLTIPEAGRISIEDMLAHEFLRQEVQRLEEEINQAELRVEPREISKAEFLASNTHFEEDVIMRRRSIQVSADLRTGQLTVDAAREAYRQLCGFKERILLLQSCLHSLRTAQPGLIPSDLFLKCEFLLVKRCYITANDLHQMLLFGTHCQGTLSVPKAAFRELVEGGNVYHRSLRAEVSRLYEELKHQWLLTQEAFSAHQRQHGLSLRPRQDAYLDILLESPGLMLAFNDCFLELFKHLAQPIMPFSLRLSRDIDHSTLLLHAGVRPQFLYDLMIVLCLPNLSPHTSLKAYNDSKNKMSPHELLYRISIAYKHWKDSN